MGRSKKYTPNKLDKAAREYFASICRTADVTEKYDTGRKDEYGHTVYDTRPVYADNGQIIRRKEYIIPPTIGGLCQALDISRQTWAAYCNDEEYLDTTSRVRGQIRAYLEQELLTRAGADVRGIIFDLENNYGYSHKRETELGEKAAAAAKAAVIPLSEREKLLEQIAQQYTKAGDDNKPEK